MMPHLTSALLGRIPNVRHGFTLRGATIESVADSLGIAGCRYARTDQVHGSSVHALPADPDEGTLSGDAFITARAAQICHVRSADCVPILIAHRSGAAVAAVHAGWRGTALDAAGEALRQMARRFDLRPADCVAAIGPRICGRCYEVGEEVLLALAGLGLDAGWLAGERRVDLGAANAMLLERAGIPRPQIEILPECTYCDARFTSYRRDRSEAGRQVNWIVIDRTIAPSP